MSAEQAFADEVYEREGGRYTVVVLSHGAQLAVAGDGTGPCGMLTFARATTAQAETGGAS
jgi:hypothetical protein